MKKATKLIPSKSSRNQFGFRSVEKLRQAGLLPKIYANADAEISKDFEKVRAILRDAALNSSFFLAMRTALKNLILGADAGEVLWRVDDNRKKEIEAKWFD